MAKTISNFASALGESARPNQFMVSFTFPTAISSVSSQLASQYSEFLVKSAMIPESTIEDVVLYYRGRPYHEAGERSFAEWTCTCYNDSQFKLRKAFEEWSEMIQHRADISGELSVANYKCDITVKHLNRQGETLRTYLLRGAFPRSVGQIQLDYETNNQVETFDVSIVFDWFDIEDTTTNTD